MRIANKFIYTIFLLTILSFISCNRSNYVSVNECGNCHMECDSLFLKLEILENIEDVNHGYFIDNNGKCTTLLVTKFGVDSIFFGGKDGFSKAINYFESNNLDSDIVKRTSISLMNSSKNFEEIWIMDEKIPVYKINERSNYGVRESKISLEDGFINHNGTVKNCIKIIYTEKGAEGGFKMNILNFIKEQNQTWKLMTRERVNTIHNDINNEKMGYCIDTLIRYHNTEFENGKKIIISNEMMFSITDAKCY